MRQFIRTAGAIVGAIVLCATARADVLANINDFLTTSDPTQLGRLSRNGIPQDWSGTEVYPGVVNTSTTYYYTTYTIPVGNSPFVQISVLDLNEPAGVNYFVSAYQGSYNPANKATNWLGDAGFSGDFAPGDPGFFQVISTSQSNIVVVVNNTAAAGVGTGAGAPYNILVEGFIDNSFDNTPEPATILLTGAGVVVLLGGSKFRRSRAARG